VGTFFYHRQDVVIVGTGRTSRSVEFVTSSELLCLLNLLYYMLSECCIEYKLIQLYRRLLCGVSLHIYIYLWANSSVASARSGVLV